MSISTFLLPEGASASVWVRGQCALLKTFLALRTGVASERKSSMELVEKHSKRVFLFPPGLYIRWMVLH